MKAILNEDEWKLFEKLREMHRAGNLPKKHLAALKHTKKLYEDVKDELIKNLPSRGVQDPVPLLSSFEATLNELISELQKAIAEYE